MKVHFQAVEITAAIFQIFIVIALVMVLKYVLYCSYFCNNSMISEVYKPVRKPLLLLFLKYVAQIELSEAKKNFLELVWHPLIKSFFLTQSIALTAGGMI